MLYMRTIPDKMRTDEVYVAAFDSIPHHCQDSELPTGEHISVSIESSVFGLRSWYLTLHSAAGTRAVRARAGLRPLMGPDDVTWAPCTVGTPAAAAASLERQKTNSPPAAGGVGITRFGRFVRV